MRISLTIAALAVALAAASAAAAPIVRPFSPPSVFHQPWHGGDRDFGRRYRHDFIGPVAPVFGAAAEPGPEEAPSALFLSAPVFVDVTLAPGAGPAPVEWAPGPKIIEIGQSAPPRRPLPLIIYGD